MLRALEIIHFRRMDECFRLRKIPTAYWPTPSWSTIVTVRLQNKLFTLVMGIDGAADIAHRDCKGALPAGTLGGRICPLAFYSRFDAVNGGDVVVVVAGYVVCVERGIYDVLCDV